MVLRHTHTAHLHRRVASHRIASSSPSSLVISIHSTDEATKRLAPLRTASHRRRSPVDSTDYEESACRRAPRVVVVVVVSSRCRGDIHLFFSHNWYVTASSLRTVVKDIPLSGSDEWCGRCDGTLPLDSPAPPSQPALSSPTTSLATVEQDMRRFLHLPLALADLPPVPRVLS